MDGLSTKMATRMMFILVVPYLLVIFALTTLGYHFGARRRPSCAEWCEAGGMRVDFHLQRPRGSDGYVRMDDHDITIDPIDDPIFETCGCLRPWEGRR